MQIIRNDEDGSPILQGSERWKEMRAGMVTGTIIKTLMGTPAAYKKAVQAMVAERLTGKRNSIKATSSMQQGTEREPFARMWYEERTGCIVEEVAFVKHDDLPVGISPDGLIVGERRLVEFKAPEQNNHVEYLAYTSYPVDGEYYGQMQAQLWVTGYEVCDFCSYNPDFLNKGLHGRIVAVLRDEVYIEKLEATVRRFVEAVDKAVAILELAGNERRFT